MRALCKAYVQFWYRNIATILLPFCVLAFCNVALVSALKRQSTQNMRTMMLSMAVGK